MAILMGSHISGVDADEAFRDYMDYHLAVEYNFHPGMRHTHLYE